MKAGQETDAGDSEFKSKPVAGKRGGLNKGAIAMTFQEALRHSETGYGKGNFGTAKNRGLDFNGFCRATRYAIRLCVYGPHYRTKRGAKRKKTAIANDSEKSADLEARNKLGVSAAPVSSAIVPVLDLRAATARPVTHAAGVRPATERASRSHAKTEMGVDGDKSGDVNVGEANTTPKKLGKKPEKHNICLQLCQSDSTRGPASHVQLECCMLTLMTNSNVACSHSCPTRMLYAHTHFYLTRQSAGLTGYFFGEPLSVKHTPNGKNVIKHRFEKGDGPLENKGGEGERAHQLAKHGRGGCGNLTSRPLTVKPSGAESLFRHRSGAETDRQLQTAQARKTRALILLHSHIHA